MLQRLNARVCACVCVEIYPSKWTIKDTLRIFKEEDVERNVNNIYHLCQNRTIFTTFGARIVGKNLWNKHCLITGCPKCIDCFKLQYYENDDSYKEDVENYVGFQDVFTLIHSFRSK